MKRLALGLWFAFALCALELVVTGWIERRLIASVWELEMGSVWLLPITLCASFAVALLGAGLYWLLRESHRAPARFALAGVVGALLGVLGYGVGGGRHLATLGARGGFALGVALVGVGLVVVLAKPLAGWLRRAPRAAMLAWIGVALALELANRFVLPRLYPAFHWALAVLAVLSAGFAGFSAVDAQADSRPSTRRAHVLLISSVVLASFVSGIALLQSSRKLANFDNFRFMLLENAPILGRLVELSARLAPPELRDAALCSGVPFGVGCAEARQSPAAEPRSVDFRGRDLLLVSIDALRADHIGAYGYGRATTPNIDRLANEGALFERAYTATPHTSYAIASLMTGKYVRPLLLQGAGADSDTFASLLRTYGYRTAAFYPPAVFFIDSTLFEVFERSKLGFEYAWVEPSREASADENRLQQITRYLASAPKDKPLFSWVHLFGPHEPYVAHPEYPFGERDIDRYDSEIGAADATFGKILAAFRAARPNAVVILTADHGEEFGEHGGHYHGTTVYEEQLRIPLLISAPGSIRPRRISEVVQSIDLLPTVLGALDVPRPPRVRGRDLGALLAGKRESQAGFAYGETEEQSLLAQGNLRLICARRIGACKLYDLERDPLQRGDASQDRMTETNKLRAELRELGASHGRYESQGLRAEGKGWPAPILRGLAGDADASAEVASLLDDVDPAIRRKAAEVLLDLRRPDTAPALRLALGRDDDPDVRRLAALALTRLGEGAPLVIELLESNDLRYRRLAALALGESGDRRGASVLLEWWQKGPRDFTQSREILGAFATLRVRDAAPFITQSLSDVRLRPLIADTLAKIGEPSARVPLSRAFAEERSQAARAELARSLVELGAREEIAASLIRFLGVPDPLPNGLEVALRAEILQHVGGPLPKERARLRTRSELGTRVRVFVPKGGNGKGVRALVRASCPAGAPDGDLLISSAAHLIRYDRSGKQLPERGVPELDATRALRLRIPCDGKPVQRFETLPQNVGISPASSAEFILFASRDVAVEAVALVPLADELPPPAPKPWAPGSEDE